MKIVPRAGSIAGGCHTAPPLYWSVCPPLSGMSKVFQSVAPVCASSATTLPRKLQHGYAGSNARVSSREEIAAPIGEINCVTRHGRSGRNITTRWEHPFWAQAVDVGRAD